MDILFIGLRFHLSEMYLMETSWEKNLPALGFEPATFRPTVFFVDCLLQTFHFKLILRILAAICLWPVMRFMKHAQAGKIRPVGLFFEISIAPILNWNPNGITMELKIYSMQHLQRFNETRDDLGSLSGITSLHFHSIQLTFGALKW